MSVLAWRFVPPAPLLCRWDIDKTYLRSEFDTLRQLWRTAWERGEDKVAMPGVPEVVKALKTAADRHRRPIATYFVSASPPQIGKAIRDKLALDGVPYDGISFKNQLEHLKRGKFRNLREHVGYKLGELLRGRRLAPAGAHELLFGDDWETDPLTYSLYADLVAGVLPAAALGMVLRRIGVDPLVVPELTALAAEVRAGGGVERIFINLARRTPPVALRVFGARLVPTFNYFQTALVLAAMGHLDAVDVATIGTALVTNHGQTSRRLANSLDDLVRRRVLTPHAARRVSGALRRAKLLAPVRPQPPVERLRDWARDVRARRGAPLAAALDYGTIFETFPNLARIRAAEGKS
jgi:hypothetical protein